jgi:predicted transcriptional regulator
VGGLVEDFGGRRLVHGNLTVREEVLVLLHSYMPSRVVPVEIAKQLDRRSPGGVRNELRRMWQAKLIDGEDENGYCLTKTGLDQAVVVIRRETDATA